MDQDRNQNHKDRRGKNGNNMRGAFILVGWALILTVALSYFSNYMNQSMDSASQVEIAYSDFRDMVEENHVSKVEYDRDTNVLLITPQKDYSYTDEDGKSYAAGTVQFYTNRWSGDEGLTDLLNEHGVRYTEPHKTEMPMILTILLS